MKVQRCQRCGGDDFDGGGGCIHCNMPLGELPPTATLEPIRAANRHDGVYARLAARGRFFEHGLPSADPPGPAEPRT